MWDLSYDEDKKTTGEIGAQTTTTTFSNILLSNKYPETPKDAGHTFIQKATKQDKISLTKASFTTWFKNTSIKKLTENSLVVVVPNIFAKEWLEKKYQKIILDSVRKHHPKVNLMTCSLQVYVMHLASKHILIGHLKLALLKQSIMQEH
jgi:hypothetical protein